MTLARGSSFAAFVVEVYFLKATFALTALGRAAREVGRALACGDLDAARAGLRSLCSRDPFSLDEPELVAGAVESVAENASDSFVAPLVFFVLFGVPGAIAYRAINTLDAVVGYHGPYEYVGKASARLDDLANLVPARLTAALLLLAGALLGKEIGRGLATWRRDARRTESPNAGRPMAAMAGLLRVRLSKPGHYTLGEPIEPLDAGKIAEAWRVVRMASALNVVLVAALLAGRDVI
jgi:adenosylcobinamide-phosphate synthase